jgi:phage terminase large subunit-like protein
MTNITAQNPTTQFTELPAVVGQLEQAREERKRLRVWLALASWLLGVLGIVSVFMLVDWMWVVPAWVRALALPVVLGLAVYLFIGSRRPYSSRHAAADAEALFPQLGQRLRTVLQYADPASQTAPASPGLLRALVRDTDRRSANIDFRKLIPWPVFERRAIGLVLSSIIGIVFLLASPSLRTAAQRMLFLPAHYTTIKVEPGDLTLKAGEDLKLAVTLEGRPVRSAHWLRRKKNGSDWVAAPLAGDPEPGKPARSLEGLLTTTLKDCQEDFEYRVSAGELESPIYHVKIVHPLLLKSLQATITPPPYTRKPPAVVKDGNWNAIAGSRIEIEIQLDRTPATAKLELKAGGKPLPERVELQIDGVTLKGVLASVTKDLDLELTAADTDLVKLEPERRRIKVAADQEPTLRFIQPEESLAVIPTTEVPIEVEARDDFGVSVLGINFKIGDGPEETLHLGQLSDQPLTAAALELLYLEKYALDYKGAITYYAFAEDNHPPKPHRVVSDLRFIDILPFKQDYQFVPGEGSCSGSSISLEELIARQRDNLNRTFALERDEQVDDAALGRLAKYEGELYAATTEFAQGIAAIAGPVPALEEATTAMQSAQAALAAKDLGAARPLEETALKGLVAARQNLRKLLKQNSSSQASACRKFDRQQSQKLRRPPAKEDKPQLAALEKDVRELARREQKFSEELEPKGSGGPQVDPPEEQQKRSASSSKPSGKQSSKGSSSGSASAANASQSSQAQPSLGEQQKQAAREAERLGKLAKKDDAITENARSRLGQASSSIEDSSRAIDEGRKAEAAAKAREAARQLESLARQLGALKPGELSDRLARARDFAQAVASAERELGQELLRQEDSRQGTGDANSALASHQRELADDAAALADVLEKLKATARLDARELAQSIAQAEQSNPPREIEQSMRQNAGAIGSGRSEQAAQGALSAAERLEALAHDFESARRAAAGPQLERLLAAEKEAAAIHGRLRSLRQGSQQTGVERALGELAARVDRLSPGEGPLRQAADRFAGATRTGHVGGWSRAENAKDGEPSYFVPPTEYTETLAAVIAALQAKIQEMIVENTLVERNGPVPPEYKKLVEDYYRVLSQDLR